MSAYSADLFLAKRRDDGTVEIVQAPPTMWISREALARLDPNEVAFVAGLMVLCDQVAYRPRGFDQHGNVVCVREPWKDAGDPVADPEHADRPVEAPPHAI